MILMVSQIFLCQFENAGRCNLQRLATRACRWMTMQAIEQQLLHLTKDALNMSALGMERPGPACSHPSSHFIQHLCHVAFAQNAVTLAKATPYVNHLPKTWPQAIGSRLHVYCVELGLAMFFGLGMMCLSPYTESLK